MPSRVAILTSNVSLYEILVDVLHEGGRGGAINVLPRIRTAAAYRSSLSSGANADVLLVDALLPGDADVAEDETGSAVVHLLKELRKHGGAPPAVIVTPHSMEEVGSFCAASKSDICIALRDVSSDSIVVCFERIGVLEGVARAARDVTVEVDLEGRLSKVRIIDERAKQTCQESDFVRKPGALSGFADMFRDWKIFEVVELGGKKCSRPVPGWDRHLALAGHALYDELVVDVLGATYLQELISRPEGLKRVNFRFHVSNELFPVPFEALYDISTKQFLRCYCPVARKLKGGSVKPENLRPTDNLASPLRVLFILAQVEGSLRLDDDQGGMLAESFWFEPLANLGRELDYFRELKAAGQWKMGDLKVDLVPDVDVVSAASGDKPLARVLEEAMCNNCYEFVHFAGHSFTTDDGRTYLVLPSEEDDRLVGVPIGSFARWAGDCGARFVYLSSCRGSSSQSVQQLAAHGIPNVLGFRWDVEDDKAADFAREFYSDLLGRNEPFAKAYRNACVRLHSRVRNASPIWASPMLVMQTEDWWHCTP